MNTDSVGVDIDRWIHGYSYRHIDMNINIWCHHYTKIMINIIILEVFTTYIMVINNIKTHYNLPHILKGWDGKRYDNL